MTEQDPQGRPVPQPTELSMPFWDATKDERLVMQRCSTCGRYCWLPERACPWCRTETLAWTEISGLAEVYSHVTMHVAPTPGFTAPYTVAVVTLDEGPLFFTNIVGIDPADVHIGLPVQVVFEDVGPVRLPLFRPR